MFQFPAFAPCFKVTGLQPAGLPHSDIPGSRIICISPGLFAAYHVLLRLREPRHPPSALAYFLYLALYAPDWYLLSLLFFFTLLNVQHVKDLSELKIENGELKIVFPFSLSSINSTLWRITDSNRWPSACKADALASWANPPCEFFSFLVCEFFCLSTNLKTYQLKNLKTYIVVSGRVELPTSTLSV